MGSVVSSIGGALGNIGSAIGSGLSNLGSAIGPTIGSLGNLAGSVLGGLFGGGGSGSGSGSGSTAGNIGNILGGLLGAYGNYRTGQAQTDAAQEAVRLADPFAPYRRQYAQSLSSLYSNPWQIANMPGYQFGLAQGLEGINRNAAASGYLGSGNRLMELMRYGQDYGSQQFGNEVSRLAGLAGATSGSPATAGQLQNYYGQSIGNAYRNTAGAIGSAAGALGGLFSQAPTPGTQTGTPLQSAANVPSGYNYFQFGLPGGGLMNYMQ